MDNRLPKSINSMKDNGSSWVIKLLVPIFDLSLSARSRKIQLLVNQAFERYRFLAFFLQTEEFLNRLVHQ